MTASNLVSSQPCKELASTATHQKTLNQQQQQSMKSYLFDFHHLYFLISSKSEGESSLVFRHICVYVCVSLKIHVASVEGQNLDVNRHHS